MTLRRQWKCLLAVVAAGLLVSMTGVARADERPKSYEEALALARAYMDEEDPARREEILKRVETWSERLDDIALALRPVPPADAPTGQLGADRFTVPRIRARMRRLEPRLPGPLPDGARLEVKDGKLLGVAADGKILWSRQHPHPEGPIPQMIHNEAGVRATALLFRVRKSDGGIPAKWPDGRTLYYKPGPAKEYLNWVYVPEDYDRKRPLGMVIYLHGGAGIDAVNHGAGFVTSSGAVGKLLRGGGHIAVCSGTPRIPISKWTFPESEILFESIIEEYSTRYAIDPNRIYLAGGSMGGYGSWHQAFRHADRFAIIAPMAAGVRPGYWPKLQGTLIYMATGIYDPRGVAGIHILQRIRRHDPRALTIINAEYPSGHPRDAAATPQIEALHELIERTRRDPYTRRVCAVAPYVIDRRSSQSAYKGTLKENAQRYPSQPHSFWASVLEHGPDGIPIDGPTSTTLMRAGAVDAENLGGNRFRVYATNVRRLALWLHPKMGVDLAKPIQIELVQMGVDQKTMEETELKRQTVKVRAKPSLAAMLQYLGDRRDHGLIYHAAVELAVGKQTGE